MLDETAKQPQGIGQPVEILHGFGQHLLARVAQPHGTSFRPAADCARHLIGRGLAMRAREGPVSQNAVDGLDLFDQPGEEVHIVPGDDGRRPLVLALGSRIDRKRPAYPKQRSLNRLGPRPHLLVRAHTARPAEHRVQLVDGAVRLDAKIRL